MESFYAARLGARGGAVGGRASTPAKRRAARRNGKLGGRPRGTQTLTFRKASGKQIYVETSDPVAIAAYHEANGRERGRAERLRILAAAGAPQIYQMADLKYDERDNPQWEKWSASVKALRAWLLARLGITAEQIARTPGNSGQFDPSLSTIAARAE